MDRLWRHTEFDQTSSQYLHKELKIHPRLCDLLASRGISSYEQARQFFRPDLSQLHDPMLMKGMRAAVDRVCAAITSKQKIMLYGDYDVDGTTAVAVVAKFLEHYYDDVIRYVPNRFTEGYGISDKGINFAISQNVNLIIALDCGIKSQSLVAKASLNNMDTIICDHHLPDENLPPAIAILNPKQSDCTYPYKELCGCGIGFKLICALEQVLDGVQNKCYANLDLVATAIAADIVPITGENRVLATLGLSKANQDPSVAIIALKQTTGLKTQYTISDLVFIVAPRVNAAGRMDDATKAVDFFMSDTVEQALDRVQPLNHDNEDRKDIDKQITEEAYTMLQLQDSALKSTVMYNKNWHKGVVGIVASRMIERKFQPTIILTDSNGKLTGSARSIPGFNLFDGLTACSDLLDTFGGHYFAAGLTLRHENLKAFQTRFDQQVQSTLTAADFVPVIAIDAELMLGDITDSFYGILNQYAPHGPENMRPCFVSTAVLDCNNGTYIVKEKHLKFHVQQNGIQMRGIGFNLADKLQICKTGAFDICYHIEANEWNSRSSIEIRVIDVRPSTK
jgi:single-stranded-DNA-specific exonuclease